MIIPQQQVSQQTSYIIWSLNLLADSATDQAAPRTPKRRRRRAHQSQLSNTSTPPASVLSFDHALSQNSQATRPATSAPSTLSRRVATPQRDQPAYFNQLTTSGYGPDQERPASRPGPPPLPPRSTRPDYVHHDVFVDELSDTLTVSDISSIVDTERNAQTEINDGEESDYYWETVDDLDFHDESLAAALSGLTMSTSNSTTREENVIHYPPVAGPSTLALNLNLADSSAEIPFQSTGPFYVVTKGSDVGVFNDW